MAQPPELIAVTGANGYLGRHIMALLGERGFGVHGDRYELCRGMTVIHAGWAVPTTMAGGLAHEQAQCVTMTEHLIASRPKRIVFVSTLTGGGPYLEAKREAEDIIKESDIPHTILRFPGLFGHPKHHGVIWENLTNGAPIPDPYACIHVVLAARECVRCAYL